MPSFIQRLYQSCESHRSLLCVGLDPYPDKIKLVADDVFEFNRAIIEATADYVCAYKPNTSFYEGLEGDRDTGMAILKKTVDYIRKVAPDVIIIGDGKRGDIGVAIQEYPKLVFEQLDLDTAIINPYMGFESVDPFLDYHDEEKGVFLLCHSSNPGAVDIQDLDICQGEEGQPMKVYEHVARLAQEWNQASKNQNMGLVVGATYPDQLRSVRAICPEMPILIPGIGAQDGDLEGSVKYGTDSEGRMAIITSSRQILYASQGKDFAKAAGKKAKELRDSINRFLFLEEKGWP